MADIPVFVPQHRLAADEVFVEGDLLLLLGLGAGSTVNDVLMKLAAASVNYGLVRVQAYVSGTTTPLSNVRIDGLTTISGGILYTDAAGKALGRTGTTTTTIRVHSGYTDLLGSAQSIATPVGAVTQATIYASKATEGAIVEILSTRSLMFSPLVASVDVHVIGGGYAGNSGSCSDPRYSGGQGGAAGRQRYALGVVPSANTAYTATVGPAGGESSLLGIGSNAGSLGGEPGGNGTYAVTGTSSSNTWTNGPPGRPSTVKLFGTGEVKGGGSGGGGGYGVGFPGGGPKGGAGSGSDASPNGANGQQPGGGGGGGAAGKTYQGSLGGSYVTYSGGGGTGGAGAVYYRLKYK